MLWFIVWGLCISPDHTQARCCSQSGSLLAAAKRLQTRGPGLHPLLGQKGRTLHPGLASTRSTSLWLLSVYRCRLRREGCIILLEVTFQPQQEMESSDIILLPFSSPKFSGAPRLSSSYDDVYEMCLSQEKAPLV